MTMNKLFLLPVAALLSACVGISSTREPILYNHAIELSVMTAGMETACGTPSALISAEMLLFKATVVNKYTTVVATDTHEVTTAIHKEYKELAAAYGRPTPPSETYCKMKVNLINQSVDLLIKMLGNKSNE